MLRASDATGIGIDDNNGNDNNGNDVVSIKRTYVKVQRQRCLPYNQTF